MPGRRLVEQQHRRPARERQRDLELALLAVAQARHRPVAAVDQPHLREHVVRLGEQRAVRRRRAQALEPAAALGLQREPHVLAHRQRAEQVVLLERAPDAELAARLGRLVGDVDVAQEDASRRRRELPGDLVDEARLAGAVRADQRMELARRDRQIDVPGDDEAAERLLQRLVRRRLMTASAP
jgi:hypothetical protein